MQGPSNLLGLPMVDPTLLPRLHQALQQTCSKMMSADSGARQSGALVQVWMPERAGDDGQLLRTTGLPFTVSGVGDLLALFRCCSCKYKFSTNVHRQDVMGAIGRVFVSGQPECSNDLQSYANTVYLRVHEARRCKIHSSMFMPLYDSAARDRPIAVFEACQPEVHVNFACLVTVLVAALQRLDLYTIDMSDRVMALGLRSNLGNFGAPWGEANWPLGADCSAVPGLAPAVTAALSWVQPDQSHADRSGRQPPRVGDKRLLDDGSQGARRAASQTTPQGAAAAEDDYYKACQYGAQIEEELNWEERNRTAPGAAGHPPHTDGQAGPSGLERDAPQAGQHASEQRQPSPPRSMGRRVADRRGGEDSGHPMRDDHFENNNRIGGGAGRRLTYKDLEAYFGFGLRDAANRLHICPTTLKRACRRHGITRWPRRQMAKLANRGGGAGLAAPRPSEQSAISGDTLSSGQGDGPSTIANGQEAGSAVTGNDERHIAQPPRSFPADERRFNQAESQVANSRAENQPVNNGHLFGQNQTGMGNEERHFAQAQIGAGNDQRHFGRDEMGTGNDERHFAQAHGHMGNDAPLDFGPIHSQPFMDYNSGASPSSAMTMPLSQMHFSEQMLQHGGPASRPMDFPMPGLMGDGPGLHDYLFPPPGNLPAFPAMPNMQALGSFDNLGALAGGPAADVPIIPDMFL